jgi:hypothetical protein
MHSPARHPEVIALALIILALGVGASPERAFAPLDACDRRVAEIETRLNEKVAEIGSRIAGRLAELGERLDSRWGSRLDSPKIPLSRPR